MQISIDSEILKELEYIVQLHQQHGASRPVESVEQLVGYVLASVADGSRRPGALERELLNMMALVADCDEHHEYRPSYGKAEEGFFSQLP